MPKPQYGWEHQKIRAKWAPVVARGEGWCAEVVCLKASRHIEPGEPWHLAHTPDCTDYLGPAHAECNTSEGATRGNRLRGITPQKPKWKKGQHDCPVCGTQVKWEDSRTCSRRCASELAKLNRSRRTECKRGHSLADAYVYPNGAQECRTCKREAKDAWRRAHPDAVRTHQAKWRAASA